MNDKLQHAYMHKDVSIEVLSSIKPGSLIEREHIIIYHLGPA